MENKPGKVVVDYSKIKDNVNCIRKLNESKEIIAVVKNNAYNCGLLKVVEQLIVNNVNYFAVARLEEAVLIKKKFSTVNVLVLNPLLPEELKQAQEYNLEVVVGSHEYFIRNKNELENLQLHLKVNVGMNRFGFKVEELDNLKNLAVSFKGLMTHFPIADENDLTIHNLQVESFVKGYNDLRQTFDFSVIHSENSATFLQNDPRLNFCTHARIGILLYGYNPIEYCGQFHPLMSVSASIVEIKELKKGEYLGYGLDNKLTEDMRIAVCNCGYGDGILKKRNTYPVAIKGKLYSLVGSISMSHMYINVDESIEIGDEVEVYGSLITFDKILGITNSEMMCSLKN